MSSYNQSLPCHHLIGSRCNLFTILFVQELHVNIVHPWQSKGSFMSTTNNASSSSNIWASSSFAWVSQTIHMIMGYINIIKVPPFSLWECVDFMTPSKHKWPQNGSFGPPSSFDAQTTNPCFPCHQPLWLLYH